MWRTVKLDDVCKIINGGTPKSKVSEYWDGDVQWLTPKDMGKLKSRHVSETERKISQEGLANSSAKLIPKNAVILSCRAPIGHVAINRIPMSFNQGCKGLVPSADLLVEYLYYFLISSKQLLNDLGTGTTFKEISGKTLATVDVPLPPLSEQQRIVAKLDAAFAEIDIAIETCKTQISYGEKLVSKYVDKLIESDGDEHTIADLSVSVTDGDHQPPPKSEYGVPFITISNLNKQSRKIDFSNTFFVPQSYYDNLKETRKPQYGDILYTVTGSFGIPVFIDNDSAFCFQRHIAIIRPKPSIDSEWLYYALLSSSVYRQADERANGAAQRTVSLKVLRELVVKVPDIEKQRSDVLKIKSMEKHQHKFVFQKKSALKSLLALKSAILAQELQPPQREAA